LFLFENERKQKKNSSRNLETAKTTQSKVKSGG